MCRRTLSPPPCTSQRDGHIGIQDGITLGAPGVSARFRHPEARPQLCIEDSRLHLGASRRNASEECPSPRCGFGEESCFIHWCSGVKLRSPAGRINALTELALRQSQRTCRSKVAGRAEVSIQLRQSSCNITRLATQYPASSGLALLRGATNRSRISGRGVCLCRAEL